MATIYEQIAQGLKDVESKTLDIKQGVTDLEAAQGKTEPTSNNILDTLKSRLLGETGIVSSEETPIDKLISESISELKTGREKTESGIKAKFERLRGEALGQGEQAVTSAAEARGGFATSMALFKNLYETTDKTLKDLDLREQEALSLGQIETANSIANLKVQQLTLKQQREDTLWNKMVQTIGLGFQEKEFTLTSEQAKYNKAKDMFNLIQDYGLTDKLSGTQTKDIESLLGLKSGTLGTIKPKINEELLFHTTDNNGNVTAIYKDKVTGAQRTQTYKGIGETKTAEKPKPIISQATLNKIAVAGVPNQVALGIQEDLNNNFSIDSIKMNLRKIFGDTGENYFNIFIDEMKKAKTLEINWPE